MKHIIIVILSLAITSLSFAQIDRSKAPVPGPAPEINIADPIVFDLDNGMKVILSTNNKIPKVSFNLVMGSDPRLEGEKAGLSDLMGDLLLSGTKNREKDQLDQEKDFIGASLFASSNSMYLSVLTKHMDKGLDLMTDVMKNANFPKAEFDRIKKQYESDLYAVKTDPNSMMSNAMYKTLFTEEHPYGEVMTEETLNNITREDVVDLYKKQYTPAGSYLVIVGDINEAEAKKVAEERFGDWEGGVPFEKEYNHGIQPKNNRVIFVEKPGAVQSVINIAFPIPMTPGDEDQIKLSVLNKLLGGGGFGTRLMQNLREDKAYTYGAYTQLNVRRQGSFMSASGNFRNEVTDSAIVQFLYEFQRITEAVPTEEELSLNKASMAGSFARRLESPRTIANFALNIHRNNLPKDYYQTYLKKLSNTSETDILEMAQKYITPNNLNIIVVGNKDVLEKLKQFDGDGEIEILDAFGNPSKEKSYLPADISKTEVLEKYLMAITGTSNMKKANKKLCKIKTIEKKAIIVPDQSPMELKMTTLYKAPNNSVTKMEFNGMVLQEEIINEDRGMSKTMSQQGGFETTHMTDDELKAELKTSAAFTEMALIKNIEDVELLGMEEIEDQTYYVLQYTFGKTTTTGYYNKTTGLKDRGTTLRVTDEGPQSISTKYSDYSKYNGYLLPNTTTQIVEAASMTSTLKEVKFNGKIDDKVFEIEESN
ncbi:peptidase M16 [Brumimicrobium salinarum]|uniref:Peptidase M16 n=1 Tax=Brumimicrobium salinarum TaxID=2058658 RepID=A0A2I0R1F0_9FLAO|nr:insulinase family protein [Brumimicrobium salinarum]PKR80399.1 peptidase M16 [Brumimicrobium salinarum]